MAVFKKIQKLLLYMLLRTKLYGISKNLYDRLNISQKRKLVNFYSQFIQQGQLVFDIGANVGNYTDVFLKIGATVVAIEPQTLPYKKMEKKYKDDNYVVLINKGLASAVGQKKMMICNAHPKSSMSKDWISAATNSGRYNTKAVTWNKIATVPVTTLDMLITEYGKPAFCKIDVEGYELNVLRGLSQIIPYISFEFNSDFLDSAIKCIEYISTLGSAKFNYSIAGSMKLALKNWAAPDKIKRILKQLFTNGRYGGDIYVNFTFNKDNN